MLYAFWNRFLGRMGRLTPARIFFEFYLPLLLGFFSRAFTANDTVVQTRARVYFCRQKKKKDQMKRALAFSLLRFPTVCDSTMIKPHNYHPHNTHSHMHTHSQHAHICRVQVVCELVHISMHSLIHTLNT